MNAEIMQLQKDNGVNMFGGCIPTLIQMPLLFAFFRDAAKGGGAAAGALGRGFRIFRLPTPGTSSPS